MKRALSIIPLLALLCMAAAPMSAQAAGKKTRSEVVMKMGSKVHLFHSSKVSVQKEIALGDVISVFRPVGKTPEVKEVGQVKVLRFIGDHYFEGEIIKGTVKVGDIAQKGESGLLVVPAE